MSCDPYYLIDMPFETNDGREPAPRIKGRVRADLIRDRALGLTLDELAEKYERSFDAVQKLLARARDEVRLAKQALVANAGDEYAGNAMARKQDRLADAYQDLADVNELLENADLTPTQRKGYLNLKSKLRHEIAEERGELPVRSHLELNVQGNPFAGILEADVDENGKITPVTRLQQ
jgi:hypothetical protein